MPEDKEKQQGNQGNPPGQNQPQPGQQHQGQPGQKQDERRPTQGQHDEDERDKQRRAS